MRRDEVVRGRGLPFRGGQLVGYCCTIAAFRAKSVTRMFLKKKLKVALLAPPPTLSFSLSATASRRVAQLPALPSIDARSGCDRSTAFLLSRFRFQRPRRGRIGSDARLVRVRMTLWSLSARPLFLILCFTARSFRRAQRVVWVCDTASLSLPLPLLGLLFFCDGRDAGLLLLSKKR